MAEGRSFQMTPMGVVEGLGVVSIDIPSGDKMMDMRPGSTVIPAAITRTPIRPPIEAPPAASPAPKRALSPRDVVQAAIARARDIRVELRHHKRLEKELAELERLIVAAKARPLAAVRQINPARNAK